MKSYASLSASTFILLFLGLAGGCATTSQPDTSVAPVVRLATDLAGTFNRGPSDSSEPLRDRRIHLSGLGAGEWIYYQVNEGADLEKVYRQRVLRLQERGDGTITQVAYTLKNPEQFQDEDAPIISLTLADLDQAFTEGCETIWVEMPNGWAGRVDPETCVIFSNRRQVKIRIASRTDLIGNRLRQAETGYDMDGVRLWGSKDGEWLTLYRTVE